MHQELNISFGQMVAYVMILITLIGIGVWYLRRQRMMKTFGAKLGMSYTTAYNASIERCIVASKMMQKYGNWIMEIENLTAREDNQFIIAVFDMRTTVSGYGDNSRNRKSVTMLMPKVSRLPDFQLQPLNLLTRLSAIIGFHGIRFPLHHAFSAAYKLEADHERFIRQIFAGPILDLLGSNPGWRIESNQFGLFVYDSFLPMSEDRILKSIILITELAELLDASVDFRVEDDFSEVTGLDSASWLPKVSSSGLQLTGKR